MTQGKPIQQIKNPIPEEYYPGNVVMGLRCEFSHWQTDEPLECYRGPYYFSWDYRTGITRHTGVNVVKRPIGDYLLAWGTPFGEVKMSMCRYIYWKVDGQVVYVLACGIPFNPETPVDYVIMTEATGKLEAWSGFSNK